MNRSRQETLVHGVVGGVLAGAVVALWFLVVDLAAGSPLRTPRMLAQVMLGQPTDPSVRLAAVYTLLHFGVFALLGLATAWLLAAVELAPRLLLGMVFGLGVLDAVHYTALLLTGSAVLTVLPAHHVLGANLLAGLTLMAYLHWATLAERPLGPTALKGYPVLAGGVATGAVGAAAVALWIFLVDIVSGVPFATPAALGSFLLLGAQSPAQVQVDVGIVSAYTVFHLLAFAAVGTVFVVIAERMERAFGLWLMVALGFIVLEAIALPTLSLAAEWVLGGRAWWAVGAGNLVAVASMGAWIWYTHPVLRQRILVRQAATLV